MNGREGECGGVRDVYRMTGRGVMVYAFSLRRYLDPAFLRLLNWL